MNFVKLPNTIRAAAAILLLTVELTAQVDVSAGVSVQNNNNAFLSPYAVSTVINTQYFGLEAELAEGFTAGYYGSNYILSGQSERNFYWHQAGAWWQGERDLIGAYIEQRFNRESYSLYNYLYGSAYWKRQDQVGDFYLLSAASFNYTAYDELPLLDNWLIYGALQAVRSFETKTTLIGNLSWSYKNYFDSSIETVDGLSKPFVSQLILSGRIAQSVTESTGLAVQLINRIILSSTGTEIKNSDFVYDESLLFDDPVNNKGYSAGVELTQILPAQIKAKAAAWFSVKEYPSQGLFLDDESYDPSVTRRDEQTSIGLSLSRVFLLDWFDNTQLTVTANYRHLGSSSNSFWYDYSADFTTLDFEFEF